MNFDADLPELPDEIRERFGSDILFEKWTIGTGRPAYRCFSTDHVRLAADEWRQLRSLLERNSWQGARCLADLTEYGCEHREYLFVAPMIPVALDYGYHATRLASLDAILSNGLLPSTPDRQTSDDKFDCEGNIYVCDTLGSLADAGVAKTLSAHWWCDHLARANNFDDPDWCIVGIDFTQVPGARVYRDLQSTSGLIVRGVERIPPSAIRFVYPE